MLSSLALLRPDRSPKLERVQGLHYSRDYDELCKLIESITICREDWETNEAGVITTKSVERGLRSWYSKMF